MTGDPEFTDEQLIAAGAEDPNLARPVPPVVHRMPAGSDPQFPCCGRWVQERLGDRMTEDPDQVTCVVGWPGRSAEQQRLLDSPGPRPADHAGHVPDAGTWQVTNGTEVIGGLTREQYLAHPWYTATMHREAAASVALDRDQTHDVGPVTVGAADVRHTDAALDPVALVPDDAVHALLDALGYSGPHAAASVDVYRTALAAAIPYLDRSAYRRGYAIGARGGDHRADTL